MLLKGYPHVPGSIYRGNELNRNSRNLASFSAAYIHAIQRAACLLAVDGFYPRKYERLHRRSRAEGDGGYRENRQVTLVIFSKNSATILVSSDFLRAVETW